MDRGAWQATAPGVIKSWTQLKPLSVHTCVGEGSGNLLQCSCLEDPRHADRTRPHYGDQVAQDTVVGPSFRPLPLLRAAGGTKWSWNPVCIQHDKPRAFVTHSPKKASRGLGRAWPFSDGKVMFASPTARSHLVWSPESRWRRGDMRGVCPEHPSTRSDGSRGICAQTVSSCQNDCAFIKNVFTGS